MNETLNINEQKLFQLIKENPFVSQQELAEKMNLSRPSVANLISGLVKKGYIKGKAYIVNESTHITCIGGANVDRKYYVKGKLQLETSNPIRSTQSTGGVARNVAENLGRLGLDVSLVTAHGQDAEWKYIEETSASFMNLEHAIPLQEEATGSYTAIINENGDMVLALADMDIYDLLTPELLQAHLSGFANSTCIIADLNLPGETITYLHQLATQRNIPLILITVSAPKMDRLPSDLNGITWLITNRDETEAYFNKPIESETDWKEAVQKWLDLGIEHVVITNGTEGSMFGSGKEGIQHVPALKVEHIEDVTGAGDAFSAAVIYSWLEGKSLVEIANAATVNAAKTIQTKYTVRQDLSAVQLQKDMEELI
ncbi:PfkB family carbohydrate kinase [Ornithinibacillus halotolerans]|uniref:Carbohydrate kinase n=1 Tax=Ornithinibacillus halotolerans TaxID=1274357 RepID=A0A916S3W2_9BACI|nr:PfkB family carbohydrate kinase [Ornithinibacillus halotolerans]GGA83174.1 carbohydrate kinase [Ornithinibacillus halotolerans]